MDAGRLLASYSFDTDSEWSGGRNTILVLIDLETGARREIPIEGDQYGAVLSGDHVAFFGEPQRYDQQLFLEISARLELIDLASDESKVVDPGMRIDGGPFIVDGLLVWSDLKPGGFRSRVKSYNLSTQKNATIIKNLDSKGELAGLLDFDGQHLLVVRARLRILFGLVPLPAGPTTLELITLDGKSKTVASVPAILGWPFDYARLVSHFVVWPEASEFVVYDRRTETTRRFAMFDD